MFELICMTIDHDRLFKESLSTFFIEFLELLLPRVANTIESLSIVFLQQEISKTERVGFEPTEPFGSFDFKSNAIDHSATSPSTWTILT